MDEGRRRRDLKESLDIAVGFVGFFAAAFFAVTLFLELTGRDALWSALTTLVLAGLLAWVWWFRRRMLRTEESRDES
jgi:membrane protein implicated in regulation of membrane protease activity